MIPSVYAAQYKPAKRERLMYEPVHDSLPGTHKWPAIALAQVIPQHQLQLALSHVRPQLVVRQEATKMGSLHREHTFMPSR